MSGTAAITAGTWRGLTPVRIRSEISARSRSSSRRPSAITTNSTTLVSSPHCWPTAMLSVISAMASTRR